MVCSNLVHCKTFRTSRNLVFRNLQQCDKRYLCTACDFVWKHSRTGSTEFYHNIFVLKFFQYGEYFFSLKRLFSLQFSYARKLLNSIALWHWLIDDGVCFISFYQALNLLWHYNIILIDRTILHQISIYWYISNRMLLVSYLKHYRISHWAKCTYLYIRGWRIQRWCCFSPVFRKAELLVSLRTSQPILLN